MPVQSADFTWYLTGGSGNTNPNASLGGAKSNTAISGTPLNDLWDNVTGSNHALGNVDTGKTTDYRVIAIKIASPLADASSSHLTSAVVKMSSSTLGDVSIQAAVASAVNTTFTAGADENTAPLDNLGAGVTFSTIPGGGLSLPADIAPGDVVHIALKRTISAGSTSATNTFDLQISGDTI